MEKKKPEPEFVAIGAKIRSIRESNDLTQDETAYRLGISRSYYSLLETGYANVTLAKILRLADVFLVDAGGFLPTQKELHKIRREKNHKSK